VPSLVVLMLPPKVGWSKLHGANGRRNLLGSLRKFCRLTWVSCSLTAAAWPRPESRPSARRVSRPGDERYRRRCTWTITKSPPATSRSLARPLRTAGSQLSRLPLRWWLRNRWQPAPLAPTPVRETNAVRLNKLRRGRNCCIGAHGMIPFSLWLTSAIFRSCFPEFSPANRRNRRHLGAWVYATRAFP